MRFNRGFFDYFASSVSRISGLSEGSRITSLDKVEKFVNIRNLSNKVEEHTSGLGKSKGTAALYLI
jgi:hypothetical protein